MLLNMSKSRVALFLRGYGRSYRFRIIAGYSAFTLVLMLAASLSLMGILNRKLEDDVADANRNLLAQAQIFGDTFVVGRIKTFVIEKFLDISRDNSVMEFFSGPPSTANLRQVQQAVTNLELYGAYIRSAGLYRQMDDTWVASDTGVTFGALASNASGARGASGESGATSFNADLIRSSMSRFDEAVWIPPLWGEGNDPGGVISYCQPVPMFAKETGRLGCFMATIDADGLRKLLLTARSDPTAFDLTIIDGNGAVLSSDDESAKKSAALGLRLREITGGSDTGVSMKDLFGTKSAVVWTKSTMADWKYIAVSPLAKYRRGIVSIFQTISAIILGLAAAGLVLVNFMTFRLYAPIREIISAARSNLAGAGMEGTDQDDLSMVDTVLHRLSGRVSEMSVTLAENAALIERAIVDDLLLGALPSVEVLNDRLRVIGKRFRSDRFGLTVIEPDESLIAHLPADQREYLLFALAELAAAELGDDTNRLIAALPGFRVVAVADDYDSAALTKKCAQLALRAKREFGAIVNIAHCGGSSASALSRESYSAATRALKYVYFLGSPSILGPDEFARIGAAAKHPDTQAVRELETLLQGNKFYEAGKLVKGVLSELASVSLSYEASFILMQELLSAIARVGEARGGAEGILKRENIEDSFGKARSVQAFGELCGRLLAELENRAEARAAAVDGELYSAVLRFIEENTERGVSLSQVAEKFAMSESHFGRWFRIANGSNFSDFMIARKLDAAAGLLVSEPGRPVKEIANRLGYLDLSYFSSLFKDKFGVTPIQYRKRALGRQ
ncbi:MAG: hypothetical protein A2Z99_18520 [Treponema sp. GWB1_62_6]|nr:MAG: hypothetical protein A2Z99_18520 [Treponema sp. GWB1_62_6]OHE64168.1 MAG: hypothetical protein A2001_11245 [Treponema sp. GWC1_61_84]